MGPVIFPPQRIVHTSLSWMCCNWRIEGRIQHRFSKWLRYHRLEKSYIVRAENLKSWFMNLGFRLQASDAAKCGLVKCVWERLFRNSWMLGCLNLSSRLAGVVVATTPFSWCTLLHFHVSMKCISGIYSEFKPSYTKQKGASPNDDMSAPTIVRRERASAQCCSTPAPWTLSKPNSAIQSRHRARRFVLLHRLRL